MERKSNDIYVAAKYAVTIQKAQVQFKLMDKDSSGFLEKTELTDLFEAVHELECLDLNLDATSLRRHSLEARLSALQQHQLTPMGLGVSNQSCSNTPRRPI